MSKFVRADLIVVSALRWYRKRLGTVSLALIWGTLAFAVASARASVAVLLEEPYGEMGRMNPTGHSAVYLDHVCAATPTELRPCHEGELGVVISRYDGIGRYDWLAIPLLPYLYSVESGDKIPETVSRAEVTELRNAYRRDHLLAIAPDLPDGAAPGGNWYELIGSAYDRTIYGFQVKSTAEQDASLIAMFNDRRNVERYNGAFRNCADFARVTINRFYPRAIRRNFIADFGLTTPKSVARSLTIYANKHPEAALTTFRIEQVKGEIRRSQKVQGVAEGLVKKYGLPLVLLSPVTGAAVLVAYIGQGRFAVPKNAPVMDLRTPGVMLVDGTGPLPAPAEGARVSPSSVIATAVDVSASQTAAAAADAASSTAGGAANGSDETATPPDLLSEPLP